MRAGRLVNVMLLLQRRGRLTAAQLAEELEVSERTILRDIEALSGSGVPVYATRGPGGGFQLLEGFRSDLLDPGDWKKRDRRPGRPRRAAVLVSPEGRRLAAVLGHLQPLRVRRAIPPDGNGWVEATFRLETIERAAVELLALGPQVEVLDPPELRREVAGRVSELARMYAKPSPGPETG